MQKPSRVLKAEFDTGYQIALCNLPQIDLSEASQAGFSCYTKQSPYRPALEAFLASQGTT